MFPPVFATAAADAAVKVALGSNPTRLYPFGEAPQGVTAPYATFQTVSGSPENYLAQRPDSDEFRVQLDVYAATPTAARNAAKALRDALEPLGYVVSWNGEFRDADTNLYRYSFDWSHLTPRA
jgi:hypothetical protein